MKTRTIVLLLGLFCRLTLWTGYALGYHHGTNEERDAWLAAATVERNDNGPALCYKDPRTGPVDVIDRAINRPDLRNIPIK